MGNKWSNRRYELPGLGDLVEETGIGPTKVGLNYDLVESALEPGVAGKLFCNPTDSTLASRLESAEARQESNLQGTNQETHTTKVDNKEGMDIFKRNASFKEG